MQVVITTYFFYAFKETWRKVLRSFEVFYGYMVVVESALITVSRTDPFVRPAISLSLDIITRNLTNDDKKVKRYIFSKPTFTSIVSIAGIWLKTVQRSVPKNLLLKLKKDLHVFGNDMFMCFNGN